MMDRAELLKRCRKHIIDNKLSVEWFGLLVADDEKLIMKMISPNFVPTEQLIANCERQFNKGVNNVS